MEATDVTIEILKSIRDEVRGVAERVGGVSDRLDGLATRVDRLEQRQTHSEVRIATELLAVVGAVNEVRDVIREELAVRRQVDDHEGRLRAIGSRLDR